MHFKEFSQFEEPAFELFKRAHKLVFDKSDGNTEYLERLSPEARLVYQVWNFDGEIHNGGFDQLFVNSLGDHCTEILSYLNKLGASNSERHLRSAMANFPNGLVPTSRTQRLEIWLPISDNDAVQDIFGALNQEFYQYKDNLAKLLHDFVRSNPKAALEA